MPWHTKRRGQNNNKLRKTKQVRRYAQNSTLNIGKIEQKDFSNARLHITMKVNQLNSTPAISDIAKTYKHIQDNEHLIVKVSLTREELKRYNQDVSIKERIKERVNAMIQNYVNVFYNKILKDLISSVNKLNTGGNLKRIFRKNTPINIKLIKNACKDLDTALGTLQDILTKLVQYMLFPSVSNVLDNVSTNDFNNYVVTRQFLDSISFKDLSTLITGGIEKLTFGELVDKCQSNRKSINSIHKPTTIVLPWHNMFNFTVSKPYGLEYKNSQYIYNDGSEYYIVVTKNNFNDLFYDLFDRKKNMFDVSKNLEIKVKFTTRDEIGNGNRGNGNRRNSNSGNRGNNNSGNRGNSGSNTSSIRTVNTSLSQDNGPGNEPINLSDEQKLTYALYILEIVLSKTEESNSCEVFTRIYNTGLTEADITTAYTNVSNNQQLSDEEKTQIIAYSNTDPFKDALNANEAYKDWINVCNTPIIVFDNKQGQETDV